MTELPFCECGCGGRVTKKGNRFISGHNNARFGTGKSKSEPQLCKCGCGELTKQGNRFICGHNRRGIPVLDSTREKLQIANKKPTKPLPFCSCGCGNRVKKRGSKFCSGHWSRGRKASPETIEKMSKARKGFSYSKSEKESRSRNKDPLPDDWKIDTNSKMATNKECALYLGCYITESILIKIFKNVQRMPNGNCGFDFYCGKGYKVDSKSSATGNKGHWQFGIRRNQVADYFLCLAFESRDDLTPIHLWLIPGNVINHKMGITISKSTICKWNQYEQPIDKARKCCNEMKIISTRSNFS